MARVFQVNLLRPSSLGFVLSAIFLSFAIAISSHAEEKAKSTPPQKPKPAKLKISGYGLTHNWELRRMLRTLELGGKKPEFFDAAFVEDAALLISARVRRDGYLVPDVFIELHLENGGAIRVHASDLLENPLPRPLRVKEARFTIRKGVLYHYKTIRFEGLETIPEKNALSYFVETSALFRLKPYRIYTPEKLRRGISSLSDVLERQGFEDARAEVTEMVRDDKTGAVSVLIKVHQGKKCVVQSVREEFSYAGASEPKDVQTIFPNKPYSRVWLQDFTQSLKTNQFHRGYPDAIVEVKTIQREEQTNIIDIALLAKIQSGLQITIGEITFKGQKHTKTSLMERRVRVQRGELLDRIRIEEGRYRLAQLGAFSTVDLDYLPIDEHSREVIYTVREGKRTDVNLLFGYGSYELLRGGIEVEEFDIWGLAHHARLKAVQSFKATSADFLYTVPELVGNDVDLFLNASALRREEVSFTREEYGGGFGAHKLFKPTSTDLTARYNYQILNAAEVAGISASEGLTNTTVGAFIFDLKHDRRDNPLYPHSG
ncbi:MAG TPA: POTRA domain-containing protein, partial [Candidatus Eisenbacteria bacterium]|nr:POTRA domain-containing protein [Candidatus Eisenbacteria bacterium]